MSERTVGVFGGSFSPVHKGHLAVVKGILDRGLSDGVWIMPCRLNPLKSRTELWGDAERFENLRKAIGYLDYGKYGSKIELRSDELERPAPSYTCDTLRSLVRRYPDKEFRLVVGADSYIDFRKWKDWMWLETNFSPIVYPRPGFEIGELRPGWTLLDGMELNDVSSSRIREMIARGESPDVEMPWLNINR